MLLKCVCLYILKDVISLEGLNHLIWCSSVSLYGLYISHVRFTGEGVRFKGENGYDKLFKYFYTINPRYQNKPLK
jgi:hypothetical protein